MNATTSAPDASFLPRDAAVTVATPPPWVEAKAVAEASWSSTRAAQ